MRFTHKFTLAFAVMAVVLALGATSASAQSDIEVWNVDEDVSCDFASGGHCTFYAEGTSEIYVLPGNTLIGSCEDEFFGEIQSDGTGVIEWVGTSGGGPGCTPVNCQTGDEDHWPIVSTTESGAGQVNMIVRLCYRGPSGAEAHCNLNLSVAAPLGDSHAYLLTTSTLCVNATRKVDGDWQIEDLPFLTDEIEFIHL